MSVVLFGSSHINRLKHYVNKLQQEFNLDGNIIIKLFGTKGGRIGESSYNICSYLHH
jgi:dihydroxyacetone kinase DhaKLM complex PTS-EIIA-like component DhaM